MFIKSSRLLFYLVGYDKLIIMYIRLPQLFCQYSVVGLVVYFSFHFLVRVPAIHKLTQPLRGRYTSRI